MNTEDRIYSKTIANRYCLRAVEMIPYVDRRVRSFVLITWDTESLYHGGPQQRLEYELSEQHPYFNEEKVIFKGDDFGCSPLHAIDSDECLRSLLSFLTLRRGDTDAEYFEDYTPEQMDFRDTHAETLSMYAVKDEAQPWDKVIK